MANLTLVIDDELLRQASVRALELGTSVKAVVLEHLIRFASGDDQTRPAIKRLVSGAEGSTAGSESSGRKWTRDDLYGDRVSRWDR